MKKLTFLSLSLCFGLTSNFACAAESPEIKRTISAQDFEKEKAQSLDKNLFGTNQILTKITSKKATLKLLKREINIIKLLAQDLKDDQKRIEILINGTIYEKIAGYCHAPHTPTSDDLAEISEINATIPEKVALILEREEFLIEIYKKLNSFTQPGTEQTNIAKIIALFEEKIKAHKNQRAFSAQDVGSIITVTFDVVKGISETLAKKKIALPKSILIGLTILLYGTLGLDAAGISLGIFKDTFLMLNLKQLFSATTVTLLSLWGYYFVAAQAKKA